MKTRILILLGVFGLLVFGSLEVTAEEQKPYVGSEGFERMKQLVGLWEGTMDMGKGPEKVRARYRLTSGGSAIVETVFEGEPHEMMTVYHDNASRKLSMTHYCMLGNQPKMVLKDMEGNELKFDLAADSDLNASEDPHMDSLVVRFSGTDRMTQQWTKIGGGKDKEAVEIAFRRVK